MFDVIPNVVYAFASLLKTCYVLSLWVGWAITTTIVGFVGGVINLISYVLHGVAIGCEDLLSFLEDIGEIVENLFHTTSDVLNSSVESVVTFFYFIAYVVTSTPFALYEAVMSIKIGSTIVKFVLLVKDAVLLLGICIWQVFALIFLGLSYINEAPYLVLLLIARAADKVIFDSLAILETHWFKSLCGLSLGYVLFLITKNLGILPDESPVHLARFFIKKLCCSSKTAWLITLAQLVKILQLLKITLFSVCGFLQKNTAVLKSGCATVVREVISYTPTNAALQIKLEKEKASTQCIVCMDKRREAMILSCKHLLMCRQCAVTVAITSGACPVCRSPIDNILPVYT